MALLIESAPDIEFDVDMVEVIGALERCNTRVEDVVALLRCVFAVLIRHSKCDQKSDEPLSILVASAEAAARDTNRFGSPKIVRALTQFVFAPACAITLAYPFPKLTKAILRLANGLFQLADARRPHITRALSTSFTVMCDYPVLAHRSQRTSDVPQVSNECCAMQSNGGKSQRVRANLN